MLCCRRARRACLCGLLSWVRMVRGVVGVSSTVAAASMSGRVRPRPSAALTACVTLLVIVRISNVQGKQQRLGGPVKTRVGGGSKPSAGMKGWMRSVDRTLTKQEKEYTTCYKASPRTCGPHLVPGSTAMHLIASKTSRVPPNILFVNSTDKGRRALICVPAKAGSTSFYFWLYKSLAGHDWPYRGPPWVHDVTSWRWNVLNATAQISRLHMMPMTLRRRALDDAEIHRFALLRDPLERAESSFYSKLSCEVPGDAADHARMIRALMRQAPVAAASLSSASQPPRPMAGKSRGASAIANASGPCLSMRDWGRLVAEVIASDQRHSLDVHFMPQADACGLWEIGYHTIVNKFCFKIVANPSCQRAASALVTSAFIVPLEDNVEGMRALAQHLQVPPEMQLFHRHSVRKRPHGLNSRVANFVRKVYREDILLLNYPSPPKNATSAP